MQKVLFIGAHPDDIELGCGATITKYVTFWEIRCIILSRNDEDPQHISLIDELNKSLKELGVKAENITIGNFRTRYFDLCRQEIRDFLLKQRKGFDPDAVFTHAFSDMHQDHVVTSQEVQRIFRETSLFGFEIDEIETQIIIALYIGLSAKDVEAKIRALSQYETYKNKAYFKPEVIKSLLTTRGVGIEAQFAEAFEVYKLVIR